MKKFLLPLALLAATMTVSAENYLHIRTDAGWEVIDLDKVDRITFTNGNMVATDASQNVLSTIAQSTLQTMYVDDTAGIDKVSADNTAATLTFDAATKVVTLLADGSFEIYNAAGALLVAIPQVKQGETVNLSGISAATPVILKNGNYSLKAIVK
jgi:hypothetical protein